MDGTRRGVAYPGCEQDLFVIAIKDVEHRGDAEVNPGVVRVEVYRARELWVF